MPAATSSPRMGPTLLSQLRTTEQLQIPLNQILLQYGPGQQGPGWLAGSRDHEKSDQFPSRGHRCLTAGVAAPKPPPLTSCPCLQEEGHNHGSPGLDVVTYPSSKLKTNANLRLPATALPPAHSTGDTVPAMSASCVLLSM